MYISVDGPGPFRALVKKATGLIFVDIFLKDTRN